MRQIGHFDREENIPDISFGHCQRRIRSKSESIQPHFGVRTPLSPSMLRRIRFFTGIQSFPENLQKLVETGAEPISFTSLARFLKKTRRNCSLQSSISCVGKFLSAKCNALPATLIPERQNSAITVRRPSQETSLNEFRSNQVNDGSGRRSGSILLAVGICLFSVACIRCRGIKEIAHGQQFATVTYEDPEVTKWKKRRIQYAA